MSKGKPTPKSPKGSFRPVTAEQVFIEINDAEGKPHKVSIVALFGAFDRGLTLVREELLRVSNELEEIKLYGLGETQERPEPVIPEESLEPGAGCDFDPTKIENPD